MKVPKGRRPSLYPGMKTQFLYTSPVLASTTQWPAVSTVDLLALFTADAEQVTSPPSGRVKNTLPAVRATRPPPVHRVGELAAADDPDVVVLRAEAAP